MQWVAAQTNAKYVLFFSNDQTTLHVCTGNRCAEHCSLVILPGRNDTSSSTHRPTVDRWIGRPPNRVGLAAGFTSKPRHKHRVRLSLLKDLHMQLLQQEKRTALSASRGRKTEASAEDPLGPQTHLMPTRARMLDDVGRVVYPIQKASDSARPWLFLDFGVTIWGCLNRG